MGGMPEINGASALCEIYIKRKRTKSESNPVRARVSAESWEAGVASRVRSRVSQWREDGDPPLAAVRSLPLGVVF